MCFPTEKKQENRNDERKAIMEKAKNARKTVKSTLFFGFF